MTTQAGNWVAESCSTLGTGDIILTGPATGQASFSGAISAGAVFYSIEDGNNREAGIGTFDGASTIVRGDIRATLVNGTYTRVSPIPISLTGSSVVSCTYNASAYEDVVQFAIDAGASETAAAASAAAALASENAAAADLVLTNADVLTTNANVVLTNADVLAIAGSEAATSADAAATALDRIATNADVVLTNADVVSTNADVVLTNADAAATNADVLLTNADAAATAADLVQTNLDQIQTTADAGATAADLVQTNLDQIQTTADAAATAADKIATNADVVTTNADVVITNADVVSTNADVVSSAASAAAALVSENAAATSATEAAASAASIDTSSFVVKTNNLSDLNSASTALTNLGIANHDDITVDGSGNVGIGTSSPGARLQVGTTTNNDGISIANTSTANTTLKQARLLFGGTDTVGTGKDVGAITSVPESANYVEASMAFSTRSSDTLTERMRIDGSGNVGIGTSSPSTKLQVAGDITATGNVTAYSDLRIKDNIEPIANALNKVDLLNGYTFDRTDIDTPRQTGVIAQEVRAVLPEAVTKTSDGTLTVAYGNMMGLMIEAIKELKAEIDELKGVK